MEDLQAEEEDSRGNTSEVSLNKNTITTMLKQRTLNLIVSVSLVTISHWEVTRFGKTMGRLGGEWKIRVCLRG